MLLNTIYRQTSDPVYSQFILLFHHFISIIFQLKECLRLIYYFESLQISGAQVYML